MTTIAIRDGVMAADSQVVDGNAFIGEVRKTFEVPPQHGGGVCAGSGTLQSVEKGKNTIITGGEPDADEVAFMWLKSDGTVWHSDGKCFYEIKADFHSIGSGFQFALGAMASGATAEEAVKIACRFDCGSGGKIWVHTI